MSSVLAKRSGNLRGYPVKAAVVIAAGSIVLIDAAGLAVPQAGATGAEKLVGVSTLQADNTNGSAGAIKVEVDHSEIFLLNSGDVTKAHVASGTKVYLSDVNKVSIDSNTNKNPAAGTVVQVDDNGVWVKPEIV